MNPILDRLMDMDKPPCESCGATMIVRAKKPQACYQCPSGCPELSIWDGIELMKYLNQAPAYADRPFVLDAEVLAAYPPGSAPNQRPPRLSDSRWRSPRRRRFYRRVR